MFNLAVLTPTGGHVSLGYTSGMIRLVMDFAEKPIMEPDEGRYLRHHMACGSCISDNRERLVMQALKEEATHLLFIDDDMGFTPAALRIMARREQRVVGANYRRRQRGGEFTAMQLDGSASLETLECNGGIVPCRWAGLGFTLIEAQVFRVLPQPWFLIGYQKTTHVYGSEDVYFGGLLRDAGIAWYIDHDASKLVYHTGMYDYKWDEVTA